ncbi:3'(2'),5'-bisphosphate nucleotidase CysQ family protein [Haliangium ochraceum]|uniref:3'(2'),5-bisphosphonucleoside 3'(2')-phosphohydrolase n=1 Tax=Haliangium ochraceum (strain DSM 14365 / JCM 11303 / SMP-2) TaxID=502025 RepID=D0LKX8_HALO1|nr:3'(2'),5'-bisphosphate nucleotidase CysQ [Haliangium ochraceum]ACY16698.1 inositol monophosphatase [Haliangium ochraceum DSM 14365]
MSDIPPAPLTRELEEAKRLVLRAGERIMRHYRADDLVVEMKPGNEPVTEADRAASQIIVAGLRAAFPGDIVISEESADDLRRLKAERVWFIDPIDGTKDFVRGREGFAVMIGLAIAHRPALGVVYQPVHQRMFTAVGGEAWFHTPDAEPRRLRVSEVTEAHEIRMLSSQSQRSPAVSQLKNSLGIRNAVSISSIGLRLCLIALGERDLYANPSSNCRVWDTCAPEAILHAAGGRLSDASGALLRYDRTDMRRKSGVVATNGYLHEAVLARLAPLLGR